MLVRYGGEALGLAHGDRAVLETEFPWLQMSVGRKPGVHPNPALENIRMVLFVESNEVAAHELPEVVAGFREPVDLFDPVPVGEN